MDYVALQDELTNDLLTRGYGSMSDTEAASDLNTIYRTIQKDRLDPANVYDVVDQAEWAALSSADQQEVLDILHIGTVEGHLVTQGSRARARFIAIFGAQSTTISALQAMKTENVSRAQELGLGAVTAGDVGRARAYPSN